MLLLLLIGMVTPLVLVLDDTRPAIAQAPTQTAPSLTPEQTATLEEATQLNRQVLALHQQGHYQEAMLLAEQALEMREAILSERHPDVAISLNNLALLHEELGNYAAAEPLYERSLQIRETLFGADHPDVALSLNNLAELYRSQGDYDSAEALLQRSLAIFEGALGENDPTLAQSLNNLAELYRIRGDYAAAAPLYQRALAIREAALGNRHPDVAQSLNNLALLYHSQGDYAAAEPLYERSLAMYEATLGDTHPNVALNLNNLAGLYQDQGNYAAAEPLFQQAISIYEMVLGRNHPTVALSLNNLAGLYQDQGNYAAAESLYQRSLTIYETALGDNHPDVAQSLNNLGVLYHSQGNYAAAEPLYQRSFAIYETALGEAHPSLALSLNNLAGLYHEQGNYTAAEPLYQRSLTIYETVLGENHPNVALSLNNLAVLNQIQGDVAAAESFFQRSLTILETALGENHPDVAQSLGNLALFYQEQGNYAAAEPLYWRSLTIYETALGEHHPNVALSLNNLGTLYQDQGDYTAAEPLYRRSLAIYETTLGEHHPNVATNLNNLAELYRVQGDYARALPLYERSAESQETQLTLNLAVTSEARRRAYLSTLADETDLLISLHLQDTPDAAALALTTLLRRKGRVLDATAESYGAFREQLTPENQILLDELEGIETQRANLVFGSPVAGQAALLAELEARAETLQDTLARRSAEFREEIQPVTLEAVQQQIPADGALVELVRYRPVDAAAPRQERLGAPRYAAYMLFRSGTLRSVDLGDAEALDLQLFAFRDALRTPSSPIQPLARELDAQLMQPIRALLGNATHLLISPDGALNLIPFAALVDETNTYLAERYTFTYLTSGRDLLRMQQESEPGQRPVLIANPDYDATEIAPTSASPEDSQTQRRPNQPEWVRINRSSRASAIVRATPSDDEGTTTIIQLSSPDEASPSTPLPTPPSTHPRSSDFSSLGTFAPLPGTQEEVDAIAPLLPDPLLLEGSSATEEALKQVDRPSILHIATHGFFLQDQDCLAVPSAQSRPRDAFVQLNANAPTECIPIPRNVEDPLLRSGLVFAGANQREQLPVGSEDGVLTAQEVAQMNLRGTQLVVLSACETGLGNVVNGDGIYGLRRAFVLAGAESQLMSLWKVDDFGTSALMQGYYERLMDGAGRSEALREVQQELLNSETYAHPYYWAGFIFSGNWRSLESL
ncbi:tetratricopeptide repeat protein [filamentous cyanobacterium LEGE 07170]|nr:tetratricopeptide repeat protein [filamentous cyanobacterium LEGE 07170]